MSADPRDELTARMEALARSTRSGASAARQDELAAFSLRVFVGSGGEDVQASMTGTGELATLEIATSAVRDDAREDLGVRIVAAVNGALAARQTALDALLGVSDEPIAAAVDALHGRMDDVLRRLDSIDARLPD